MSNYDFHTGGYCPYCLHASGQCTCWKNLVKINNKIMDERLKDVNLIDELWETNQDVEMQLTDDGIRYGDTWKERGLVYNGQSQEERFFAKIQSYMNDFRENGTKFPWLKVIGEAHIALVRERKLK
jgi:hypothetical protein